MTAQVTGFTANFGKFLDGITDLGTKWGEAYIAAEFAQERPDISEQQAFLQAQADQQAQSSQRMTNMLIIAGVGIAALFLLGRD